MLRAEGENLVLKMADGTNILKFGEKSYNENKGIVYLLEKTKFNLEKEEQKDDGMERLMSEIVRVLEKRGNNKKSKEILEHVNHLKNLKKINDEMERINNIKDEEERFKQMLIFGHNHKDMIPDRMKNHISLIEDMHEVHNIINGETTFEDFINEMMDSNIFGVGDE